MMDIFTPITNAECVVPPKNKSGGRRRTFRSRGGRRKTPRSTNYHSPKHTRKGRKSRKTRRTSRR